MTPVASSPLMSLALTKSCLTAVAQISVVCNLILGRHPQAHLAHSAGGRSGRWTQSAATGNQTILWEVACWAGNLTGRPRRFVPAFLCNSRAGSRSDQGCRHRGLQTNARQLMWGSAWEGVHRSPELLLSVAEVSAVQGGWWDPMGWCPLQAGDVIPCSLRHVRGLNPDCAPREVPGSGRVCRFLLLRAYRYVRLKEVCQPLYRL